MSKGITILGYKLSSFTPYTGELLCRHKKKAYPIGLHFTQRRVISVRKSPGRLLELIFAGLSEPQRAHSPYPIIFYFVANLDPILVTFGQICNFRHPNCHFHFLFSWIDPFFTLNETTLLSVCSISILVLLLTVNMTNSLTPKNPKMCDPILVTLLKMRPHYSQSSRKNATPSSGTSPLTSYKAVPPPPPPSPPDVVSGNIFRYYILSNV